MLLNDADAVYQGDTPVDAVYSGTTKVWPSTAEHQVSVTIEQKPGEARILGYIRYLGEDPDEFKMYVSTDGGVWHLRYTGLQQDHDTYTQWGAEVQMKVESIKDGLIIGTALSNMLQISAEPPPPTQQKTVTLSRLSDWKTWKWDGTQRTDTDGKTYGFSGYFSGTWGNQSCSFRFAIPADLRNCKSVDKVEVSIWNDHSYNNSGRWVPLSIHHYSSLGSSSSGGTPEIGAWSTAKDGWIGGNEWIDITNQSSSGRYTAKEEFRSYGAHGIRIMQGPSNSQSYYGFVRNDVRMRFTYTVYT